MKPPLVALGLVFAFSVTPFASHAAKPAPPKSAPVQPKAAVKTSTLTQWKTARVSKSDSSSAHAARGKAAQKKAERQNRRQGKRYDSHVGRIIDWLSRMPRKRDRPVYNKSMSLSSSTISNQTRAPLPSRGRISVSFASTTAQAGDIYTIERPREGAGQ